jgi:hypothetical protein
MVQQERETERGRGLALNKKNHQSEAGPGSGAWSNPCSLLLSRRGRYNLWEPTPDLTRMSSNVRVWKRRRAWKATRRVRYVAKYDKL